MSKLKSSFLSRPPSSHQMVATCIQTLMTRVHNISTAIPASPCSQKCKSKCLCCSFPAFIHLIRNTKSLHQAKNWEYEFPLKFYCNVCLCFRQSSSNMSLLYYFFPYFLVYACCFIASFGLSGGAVILFVCKVQKHLKLQKFSEHQGYLNTSFQKLLLRYVGDVFLGTFVRSNTHQFTETFQTIKCTSNISSTCWSQFMFKYWIFILCRKTRRV